MTFFTTLICIKVILLGAVYGRLDGGGFAKVSEWVERSLIMFFFVLACAPFAGLWAFLAYAGVVGIATGHGQYFLNRKLVGQSEHKESTNFIVTWLFGKDWREDFHPEHVFTPEQKVFYERDIKPKLYWRNVFGMFVTGALVGIPALVISLCFGQFLAASIFALTGAAKAIAYIIGYEVWKSTEPAEYINGALRNVICITVILLVLNSV